MSEQPKPQHESSTMTKAEKQIVDSMMKDCVPELKEKAKADE